MFKDDEIKTTYQEDTRNRHYHQNIITKPKPRLEDTPGEVHSLQLNKPMVWKEFKELTDNLKRMYIKHLRDTYRASGIEVRLMLGCSPAHFHRTLTSLDLIGVFPKGKTPKRTKQEQRDWETFLNSNEKIKSLHKLNDEVKPDNYDNTDSRLNGPNKISAKINEINFTQSGPFDFKEFTKRLEAFLIEGSNYVITVKISDRKDTTEQK